MKQEQAMAQAHGSVEQPLAEAADGSPERLEQVSLMHIYRGQITLATTWLARMDRTTNWAVLVTSALLTFALGGGSSHPRGVLLLAVLANLFLLHIEARRYCTYDVWSHRIRLIESEALAPMLVGQPQSPGWRTKLQEALLYPRYTMSLLEAMGRRLRRTYGWLFLVLLLAYLGKLITDPYYTDSPSVVLERAQIGHLPGWVVLPAVLLFYLGLLALAVFSTRLHAARAFMLPFQGGEGD